MGERLAMSIHFLERADSGEIRNSKPVRPAHRSQIVLRLKEVSVNRSSQLFARIHIYLRSDRIAQKHHRITYNIGLSTKKLFTITD
jgi:hypothetical protein